MSGELIVFLALIATGTFVFWANGRLLSGQGNQAVPPKKRYIAISLILTLAVFLSMIHFNFPHMLQKTDGQIREAKALGRNKCLEAFAESEIFGYQKAEEAILDTKLANEIHKKYEELRPVNLDKVVRKLANIVFTGTGMMFAVVPFIVLILASMFFPATRLPQNYWRLIMGVVNTVTVASTVVFFIYHMYVKWARVDRCIKTSGHWFTFTITTFALSYGAAHFVSYAPFSSVTVWYLGWSSIYLAFSMRWLATTQQFYHDDIEAMDGMKRALFTLPIIVLSGFVVSLRASDAYTFILTPEEEEAMNAESSTSLSSFTPFSSSRPATTTVSTAAASFSSSPSSSLPSKSSHIPTRRPSADKRPVEVKPVASSLQTLSSIPAPPPILSSLSTSSSPPTVSIPAPPLIPSSSSSKPVRTRRSSRLSIEMSSPSSSPSSSAQTAAPVSKRHRSTVSKPKRKASNGKITSTSPRKKIKQGNSAQPTENDATDTTDASAQMDVGTPLQTIRSTRRVTRSSSKKLLGKLPSKRKLEEPGESKDDKDSGKAPTNLLSAIRRGKRLRRVTSSLKKQQRKSRTAVSNSDDTIMANLRKRIATRRANTREDSDLDSDDSDW